MQDCLLLIDIGNTSTKICFLAGGGRRSYAVSSDPTRTPDSWGLDLLALAAHAGVRAQAPVSCLVTSVVPSMDPVITAAVTRFVGCPVFFVPQDLPVPMENRYTRPAEVGSDRLVGAYAARMLYPDARSLVVVDFGTAVTFDCITDSAYLGGLIFPGPQTALGALSGATAKLPRISLETSDTEPAPCRDTVTSIRHGIVFGFASLVDGLTARLASGLPGPVRIVGTGGFARDLRRVCASLSEVRQDLLMDGLELLWRARPAGCCEPARR